MIAARKARIIRRKAKEARRRGSSGSRRTDCEAHEHRLLTTDRFCRKLDLQNRQAEVAEWQTRRTQNPVPARACGFKSHLRYSERNKRPRDRPVARPVLFFAHQ
jgi:hypothetical protein